MDPKISFKFRGRYHMATYAICQREQPTYIYISLSDPELIREFGEEIVIHSEGETMLSTHIYTEHRQELYQTLFEAVSSIGELKENHTSK